MKVVGFLAVFAVFIGPGADLCQGFVSVVLPSPQPSPMGEGVDVGMSRMLWAGSKAKVSLRPVWLLRAS